MTNKTVQRYPDADLEEFRVLIEQKLERAKEQLSLLQGQILEVTENNDGNYGQDMMDDSNTNTDVEMLNSLAIHQRKYIRELENALGRIRNKTYGICEVSGELIDKKRLLAVPTTTKSLAVKLGVAPVSVSEDAPAEEEEEEEKVEKPAPRQSQRQVITKVIRKLPKRKSGEVKPQDIDEEEFMEVEGSDNAGAGWNEEEEEDSNEEVPYQDMDEFPDESEY